MNEKQLTLKEISSIAEQNYQSHLSNEKKAESANAEYIRNSRLFNDASWYPADQTRLAIAEGRSKDASEAAVHAGAEHYRDNEAAYHDIAVIEAHLAGVAVNVEQPIVLGKGPEETKREEAHE